MEKILVIDDEKSMCEFFELFLGSQGYEPTIAHGGEEGLHYLEQGGFDLVITDIRMPKVGGLDILRRSKEIDSSCPVIAITANATPELAAEAMMLGAHGYLPKPFSNDLVLATIKEALNKRKLLLENAELKSFLKPERALEKIIGSSEAIKTVKEMIKKVAGSNANVLIVGESGTGKELVAKAIHELSSRRDFPFVPFNCGAIPEELLESELFGYEKGAFTGADKNKPGIIESAEGGTVFLDEVAEFPLSHQVKLLRVLQERKVRRVGAMTEQDVDVRIIAATHRSLQEMVKKGSFREDLFYRLNVIEVRIPPLRERKEDIPALVFSLIQKVTEKNGKSIRSISPQAMKVLEGYSWKGNVRELENIIERSVILESGEEIQESTLPDFLMTDVAESAIIPSTDGTVNLDKELDSLELGIIAAMYKRCGKSVKKTAKRLQITPRSLRYRLRKYHILDDKEASEEE